MSSSPTQNLRLELQATGENANTWGGKLNTLFQLLENAISKRTALVLTDVNVTLSANNYADDQSRNLVLACSGTLTGNVSVIVPDLSHFYLVENTCTGAFTLTVKTSGGTGVVVPQATTTIVYCNGTDTVVPNAGATDADTLDGLDSTAFAILANFNQFAAGSGHTFTTLADGPVVTLDALLGDRFIVTLAGNRSLDVTNPSDGQEVHLWVVQDGGGSRTLSLPSNFVFENGLAPTLTTSPAGLDVLKFEYNLARDEFVCNAVTGTGAASSIGLVLAANEMNVDIFLRAGSPGASTTVNVLVQTGVIIQGSSSQTPAMDFRGFANGTTVNLVNQGYILGRGGRGGNGAGLFDQGPGLSGAGVWSADNGSPGGNAIVGPGAGRTFNLNNGSGFIWGGGGGGGGGGASGPAAACVANGGGGGGGVGSGSYGRGGKAQGGFIAADGSDAGTGANGSAGSGGAGTGSGASGGAGGNGGDWGAVGDDGIQPGASATNLSKGTGGAAGLAIDQNGGVANFSSGASVPHVKGAVT